MGDDDLASQRTFGFDELEDVDLIVDAIYEGGNYGDVRDDPPLVLFKPDAR